MDLDNPYLVMVGYSGLVFGLSQLEQPSQLPQILILKVDKSGFKMVNLLF